MTIRILAFAQAREALGGASASLELPAGSRVGDALALLERRHPSLAALRPHLAVAVNAELARAERPLTEGCELALLPPVSGG